MVTLRIGRERIPVHPVHEVDPVGRVLLACGILSSLLYLSLLLFVPLRYPGYSSLSRTVSELSAIDAPTRALWVALVLPWAALYGAFGWGVWRVSADNRRLRGVGVLITAAAIFGLFWPPMHQREVLAAGAGTLTDTLHLVWAAVNGVLTLAILALGAAALGPRFRSYSIATLGIVAVAGYLTCRAAPAISAGLETPWIGVWERISIGGWLLWVAVLGAILLRRGSAPPPRRAA